MADESYAARTIASIQKHCAARNIVEVDGVLAELAQRYGKPVSELSEPELKKLNRELPLFLIAYLDGAQRR